MRAVILAVVIFVCGATAFGASGPLDQGAVMIGGQAYVTTYGGELYDVGDETLVQVFLAPAVGVFVGPGVMLGGQMAISYINAPHRITETLVGPVARYYIGGAGPMRGRTSAYVGASVLYHSVQYGGWSDNAYTGASLALELGGAHFVADGVALEFGIRYQHDTLEHVSGDQIIGTVGFATYLW